MCDPSAVRNWLIASTFPLAASVVAIGLSIKFNLSIFLTIVASGWMLVAALLVGLTILFISLATGALDAFCTCAGKGCESACTNMRNLINASRAALGILASTCLAGAIPALVPIVGQFGFWPIIGSLLIQLALIVTAIFFYIQLSNCMRVEVNPNKNEPLPPPTRPV